jgi:hypothetical protein
MLEPSRHSSARRALEFGVNLVSKYANNAGLAGFTVC